MTLSGAGRGGGGRRGFRRPLRRRIERFNRLVFSRFLYPKSGKINSRGARSCNANLHRDAFFKKIAPPNSQPAAFPVISRLLKFPASPLPSTFGERTSTPSPRRWDVKLEICARTSHSVDLLSRMMIV